MEEFEALVIAGHAEIPPLLLPAPHWMRRAACAGQDIDRFYPEKGGAGRKEALALCERCPVRASCLRRALAHDESGIWGRTTEPQRKARLRHDAA